MAQWGSSDATSNSVVWAPAKYNLAPNTANRDALYGNTTADAFVTGQTIGMYAVDSDEIKVGTDYLSGVAMSNNGTSGSYAPAEVLTIDNTGATYSAEVTLEVVTTQVRPTGAAVNAGGSGYANGDTITTTTGTGTGAIFTVTTGAADDIVASVVVTDAGSYTTNPTLTASPTANVTGTGVGCTLDLLMDINDIRTLNPGSYTVNPTSTTDNALADSASGDGATADLTFATAGAGTVAHTGWIVRTEGTGGRAGRIQTEVLVAGGIVTDNDDDDTVFPDS